MEKKYQICKSCSLVFNDGSLKEFSRCACQNTIVSDGSFDTKSESELTRKEKSRLKKGIRVFEKNQKILEKQKKIDDKEKRRALRAERKAERDIKKQAKLERKGLKERVQKLTVKEKPFVSAGRLKAHTTYSYFDNLPEELKVTEAYTGYVVAADIREPDGGEVGLFKRFNEKGYVEFYNQSGGLCTVEKDSIRKFIKGHDKRGDIYQIEALLAKFGSIIRAIRATKTKKDK